MSKLIKSEKRFWLSSMWICIICILCFLPSNDSLDLSAFSQWHIDKIAHVFLYGVLAFLLQRDNVGVLQSFTLCFFLGLVIEFCQGQFLPSRYFEMYDLIANIIGYFIGIGLYNLIKNKAYV